MYIYIYIYIYIFFLCVSFIYFVDDLSVCLCLSPSPWCCVSLCLFPCIWLLLRRCSLSLSVSLSVILRVSLLCSAEDLSIYLCPSMSFFMSLCLTRLSYLLCTWSLCLSLPLSDFLCLSLSFFASLCLSLPLSVFLCLSLFFYMSLCLPVPLAVFLCLYVFRCFSMSACASRFFPFFLSVALQMVFLFFFLCLAIILSMCLSDFLCVCLLCSVEATRPLRLSISHSILHVSHCLFLFPSLVHWIVSLRLCIYLPPISPLSLPQLPPPFPLTHTCTWQGHGFFRLAQTLAAHPNPVPSNRMTAHSEGCHVPTCSKVTTHLLRLVK